MLLLFLLESGAVHAFPDCAFRKFNFTVNDIVSSLTISTLNRNADVFIVNVKPKDGADYVGRFFIFDGQCNAEYVQKLDYYPISVFILDDGFSGVIFNLMQSGDGTYILDAYYLSETNVSKIINEATSNPFRPAFVNDPDASAPTVKTYNRFYKICDTYKFNNKKKRYIKNKSNKICKFNNNEYCC